MKKIRFTVLALVAAMSLTLLAACGGNKAPAAKNVPVADLYAAVEKALPELPMAMDLDDDMLKDMYGIDAADLEEYVCKLPMMMVHATEFFVAKVKDGKMDTVKAALEARQKALDEQWSWYLPEQYELVQNYKLITNGNYVLFAICEDSDAAANAFNDALK